MSGGVGPTRVRRLSALGVLVALVVVAAIVQHPADRRSPVRVPEQIDAAQIGAATFAAPDDAARDRSMPVSPTQHAASVTWFCGGARTSQTRLILTNLASTKRTAVITAVPRAGRPRMHRAEVPASSAVSVPVDFAGPGTFAATVESRHGGLVVSQRITVDGAVTTAGCATSSSTSWFFAGGDTQRGASEKLVLFNPFDDLATADVTFLTPDGFRRPQATQGLAVPGRSVVIVDAGKVQNRRSGLGSAVTTRAGRLIAWRLQSFDGTGPKLAGGSPPNGVSLALGQSTPLDRFAFPTAVAGTGVTPRIILANPGAADAKVRLSFAADTTTPGTRPTPAVIDLVSGAVKVLTGADLRQAPTGVPFSVTGRVISGGAVVAELWLDGAAPARGRGSFAVATVPLAATRWVSPVGLSGPQLDQLGLSAPGRSATVRLWVLGKGARKLLKGPALPVKVPASGRVSVDLSALLRDRPGDTVLVTADAPIVVSRLQAGSGEKGLVSSPAIPIRGGHFTNP